MELIYFILLFIINTKGLPMAEYKGRESNDTKEIIRLIIKSCRFNISETYYECTSQTSYRELDKQDETYTATVPQCMTLHNREAEIIEDFYQSPLVRTDNKIEISGFTLGKIWNNGTCWGEKQRLNRHTYKQLVLKIKI